MNKKQIKRFFRSIGSVAHVRINRYNEVVLVWNESFFLCKEQNTYSISRDGNPVAFRSDASKQTLLELLNIGYSLTRMDKE